MVSSPIPSGWAARVLVCVLAAGSSTRMGFPKLLATYPGPDGAGTRLLERACRAALDSRAAQVAVVTGAYAAEMAPVIERLSGTCASSERRGAGAGTAAGEDGLVGEVGPAGPSMPAAATEPRLVVLRNDAWSQGQSSSVRLAARHALAHGFDAAIFMAADQPFVEAAHLDALVAAFENMQAAGPADAPGAPYALRSRCGERQGNPCLFPREALPLFETLAGDEGARQLFRSGALLAVPTDIPPVPECDVFCDLDTPEEFMEFARSAAHEAGRRSRGAIG